MKTQLEIEQENLTDMIHKATSDFNKAKSNGSLSDFSLSNKVIPWYIGELSEKLDKYKVESLSGAAKVKPVSAKMLTVLDSPVVAHYTVKCLINTSEMGSDLTALATKLSRLLEVEYYMSKLGEDDKKVKNDLVKYIQNTSYTGNRKMKITRDLLGKYHNQIIKNTKVNFMKLSLLAINMLSECQPIINTTISPPLFVINSTGIGKDSSRVTAILLPWFKEWILDRINSGELLTSIHTAMVEKPIDWTGMSGGGFHSERFKFDIIKTRVPNSKYYGVDMSNTLTAINKIQATEWRVNYEILEVMMYAKDNNLGYGGLPRNLTVDRMPYPFPNKTVKDLSEKELVTLKAWRRSTNAQYDEKVAEDSKYLAMFRVLEEAKRFSVYSEIYFTYFLDFRGRIYPKSSNFHPQGTDYIKSLLHFSEGKPIVTLDDEMFLAMQGANSFGIDKETFINKHKWVLEHEDEIIESANNPHDVNTLWQQCDEDAWQFLAFCFEWRDYRAYKGNFKSRIAIAMDGSCNGLQHLGAMFMDEIGGKSVNLTNNTLKGDIYSDVKDETERLLRKGNSDIHKLILNMGITRKMVKRSVMIVPYAGTSRASSNYIRAELVDKGYDKVFGDDFFEVLVLLSDTVWEAIGNRILKGREAMEYLGHLAKAIVKETKDIDITWTTPNGFRVIQRKMVEKGLGIKTPLGDNVKMKKYINTKVNLDTDKTNGSKHKSSIAPNLVHSLDACHLQNTVLDLPNGTSLAMIHDSFGTHAADSRAMFDAIRKTFYDMYAAGDILDKFLIQQPLVDVDGKPSSGNLDLSEVLKSEHFFS